MQRIPTDIPTPRVPGPDPDPRYVQPPPPRIPTDIPTPRVPGPDPDPRYVQPAPPTWGKGPLPFGKSPEQQALMRARGPIDMSQIGVGGGRDYGMEWMDDPAEVARRQAEFNKLRYGGGGDLVLSPNATQGQSPTMGTPPPGIGNYGSGDFGLEWMNDPNELARRMALKGRTGYPEPPPPQQWGINPPKGGEAPISTKGLPAQPNGQTPWY